MEKFVILSRKDGAQMSKQEKKLANEMVSILSDGKVTKVKKNAQGEVVFFARAMKSYHDQHWCWTSSPKSAALSFMPWASTQRQASRSPKR